MLRSFFTKPLRAATFRAAPFGSKKKGGYTKPPQQPTAGQTAQSGQQQKAEPPKEVRPRYEEQSRSNFAEEEGEASLTSYEQTPAEWKAGPSVATDKPKIEEYAYMEYKKKSTAPHNDPKSKKYVYSELDEADENYRVNAHNSLIDRLKHDIKMQQQVYDLLEKMDRPYLEGVPGIHKNISAGLKNYGKPGDLGFTTIEDNETQLLQKIVRNEDRFLNQTIFTPKYARIKAVDVDYQNEVENRPVNPHFHPDKGYKFDVEVPYAERAPHVADRRGYPEILGTPVERLMRLEGEIYHPVYLDQPFVQTPSADPNPSLNFEEGEVIYENTRILEWSKFWIYGGLSAYFFGCYFIPFNLIYKTHLTLPSAYEHMFVPTFTQSAYFFDNNGFHIPITGLVGMYTAYIGLSLMNKSLRDYVVRLQYNKDKELLFVTRVSPYGSTEEEVYEMAHLEVLPPSARSGIKDMSFQDKDGLMDVTCLNTLDVLALYKENNYWNPALKDEFLSRVTNLWTPDLYNEGFFKEAEEQANAEKIVIGSKKHAEEAARLTQKGHSSH